MRSKYKGFYVTGITLLVILLAESTLTGILPHTRGHLFTLLENKDTFVWTFIIVYFSNYFFLNFFQAIKSYFVMKAALFFRTRRAQKLGRKKPRKQLDTIPQRIQDDIRYSYQYRLTVLCEYVISGLILLYLIFSNLDVPVLVLASLIYAVVTVFIAKTFSPKLTRVEKKAQEAEANYRNGLFKTLKTSLIHSANFATLRSEKVRMHYNLFTQLQLGIMNVLPYLVLIPLLFSGSINLGGLVEHVTTFQLLVVNASILIYKYAEWIKGVASEERVKEIERK